MLRPGTGRVSQDSLRLGLSYNDGFEIHSAKAVHFGIDIVIVWAINEANISHFSSDFEGFDTALYFHVLDDCDRVAIAENVASGVLDHSYAFRTRFRFIFCLTPFVGALWTHQKRTHLIGVDRFTFGAGREAIHVAQCNFDASDAFCGLGPPLLPEPGQESTA